MIVGIVFGSLAFIGIVVGLVILGSYLVKRMNRNNQEVTGAIRRMAREQEQNQRQNAYLQPQPEPNSMVVNPHPSYFDTIFNSPRGMNSRQSVSFNAEMSHHLRMDEQNAQHQYDGDFLVPPPAPVVVIPPTATKVNITLEHQAPNVQKSKNQRSSSEENESETPSSGSSNYPSSDNSDVQASAPADGQVQAPNPTDAQVTYYVT